MHFEENTHALIKQELISLLRGGFAPNVILLREFHFDKTGIVLDGLHFSAYSLLGHISARQAALLSFMKEPAKNPEVWKDAHWPQNFVPENEKAWQNAINSFEQDLEEMISVVEKAGPELYKVQENGKTIYWAAMANLHHNGYHIGQMKAIGRQLGVW